MLYGGAKSLNCLSIKSGIHGLSLWKVTNYDASYESRVRGNSGNHVFSDLLSKLLLDKIGLFGNPLTATRFMSTIML